VNEITTLLDQTLELIDSGNLELPVFDKAAGRLQALCSSDDVDAEEVEQLILSDQVFVAEILRAANSPFFGGLSPIHTIRSAIVRLGLWQVAHLALMASHCTKFEAKDPTLRQMMHQLRGHATATALAAGWITRKLGHGKQHESEAFLGGLLHDIGKLAVLRAIDQIKLTGNAPSDVSAPLIDEILDMAHPLLGANLLKRWDVPELYCEIARDHDLNEFDPTKTALVAVRLANNAAAKMGLSLQPNPSIVLSVLPEALSLNATEILIAELEIMLEDTLSPGPR
jgi:HD-like signal output (HDOD) protein